MANVNNLNSFLASLVKKNLGDTNKNGSLSAEEQKVNDALFNFSSEAGSMWDKMLAGEWDEANDIADDLTEDIAIAAKREIAEVLSEWDADDDGKINVSEIDEDSAFGTVANIFAGDTTTTFSIEDFQRFNKMLDLNEDGEISKDAKSNFGTLVASIKTGKFADKTLTDAEKKTALEALQNAIKGVKLSADQSTFLDSIKGAYDTETKDETIVEKDEEKGDDKTPTVDDGDDKTPTVNDGDDKTPTVGDGDDKTPTVGDGDDKTPTVGDGDDKTPTVGDGDDKKDTNFTLPAGWTDADKQAFNNVKDEIAAFGIFGEVAKAGDNKYTVTADDTVYTYEIDNLLVGSERVYNVAQIYTDEYGDEIRIDKTFYTDRVETVAFKKVVDSTGVEIDFQYRNGEMTNDNVCRIAYFSKDGSICVTDNNVFEEPNVVIDASGNLKIKISAADGSETVIDVTDNAAIYTDGTFKIGSKEYNADGTEKVAGGSNVTNSIGGSTGSGSAGGSTGSGSTGGSTPEPSENNFAEVIDEDHLEAISAFGITSGNTTLVSTSGKTTTYTVENGGVTYNYKITQSTEGYKTRYDVTQTYTDAKNDSIFVKREKVFVDNSEDESLASNFVIVDNGNNIKEIFTYTGDKCEDSTIIGTTLAKYDTDGNILFKVDDMNKNDNTKYEIKGDKIVVLLPKKDGTSVEIEVTSDIAIAADGTIAGRKFVDGYLAEGLIDDKWYEDGIDTTETVDLSTLPTEQGANTNITWKRVDVDGEKELRYNVWTHGDWNYSDSTYDANGRLTGMDVSKKDGSSAGKYFDAVYEPTPSFKLETSKGLIVTFDGLITNGSDAEIIEIKKADGSGYTGLYANIYYVNGTKQEGRGLYGDTLYENGSPVADDSVIPFGNKLYRGGVKSTAAYETFTAEDGSVLHFANGELIDGLSPASGRELYYENGKLFTGTGKDGNNYINGDKVKGEVVFDATLKVFQYNTSPVELLDGPIGDRIYEDGKLISETTIEDGKTKEYNYESSEFDAQGRPTSYEITIKTGSAIVGKEQWSEIVYKEDGRPKEYTRKDINVDGVTTKITEYKEVDYNLNDQVIRKTLVEKDAEGNVTSSIEKLNIKYNEAGDVTSESERNYVIEAGKVTSAFKLTEGGTTVMCSGVDGDGNPVIANEIEIAGKMYKDGVIADEIKVGGIMYVAGEKANKSVKNADGEDIMYKDGVIADEIKVGDIMYKDGKAAQSVIIGDKMYDAGKLANDVIINNALWMNGEKVDNLQNSVLGIVGILAGKTADANTFFTADNLKAKWASLNNHQRAILSHFVELDENGKVKLDANNEPIINDFFYMVANNNVATKGASGAAIQITSSEFLAALGCSANNVDIMANNLEKLQILKQRVEFLKEMDCTGTSFLDGAEVSMAEIRNRQNARTALGLTEDLDNYTWKLINGEQPNTTASTSKITLNELISAGRDAKFYENAKVVSELIQEIDGADGTKDGSITAENMKILYNRLLENPVSKDSPLYEKWNRKLNMLKNYIVTDSDTKVMKNGTAINSAALMETFFKNSIKMLENGTIDAPQQITLPVDKDGIARTNWTVQKFILAVYNANTSYAYGMNNIANNTVLTPQHIITAYNTTTNAELKALLSVLVNDTDGDGLASEVSAKYDILDTPESATISGTTFKGVDDNNVAAGDIYILLNKLGWATSKDIAMEFPIDFWFSDWTTSKPAS